MLPVLSVDALPLARHIEAIGGKAVHGFHHPARPSDLDAIHADRIAEPDVRPEVVLRHVAAAASYFHRLAAPTCGDCHRRTHGAPIASGANQSKRRPMPAGAFI